MSGLNLAKSRLGEALPGIKEQLSGQFYDQQSAANNQLIVNQFEETRQTKTQAFVYVNKINVLMLQTSLVEEVISFSALDNIKDLTCISLLAASLGPIELSVRRSQKDLRSLRTFISSNSLIKAPPGAFANFATTQRDLVSRLFSKKPKKQTMEVEPLTIETHDVLSEENVAIAKVNSLHAQLSRLRNSSSVLKEAVLTIIPPDQSKVAFTLDRVEQLASPGTKSDLISAHQLRRKSSGTNRGILKRQEKITTEPTSSSNVQSGATNYYSAKQDWDDVFVDVRPGTGLSDETSGDTIKPTLLTGFIMFEAGLERISIDAVKTSATRPSKNDTDGQEEDINLTKSDVNESENPTISKTAPSPTPQNQSEPVKNSSKEAFKGAASFAGELGAVWFNFAAPPKTPNTRKIDYTRLDWHLLSTGTPSINAWLAVIDRILFAAKRANRLAEQRKDAVVSCLMTLALEVPGIHVAPQTKYLARKRSPLAKALQEDPSCQLIAVLRR